MKTLRPVNPFTLKPTDEYPVLDFDELTQKVGLARKAFEAWRGIDVAERVNSIRSGLEYFRSHRDKVAQDITSQMGKPIAQSENEIGGLLERAEYLLSIAESTLRPEPLPPKPGFLRRIEHVPLGVVFIIAPWNYPLLTAMNGIATALLSGNTVLLKHSSLTPAIGEHFARAFGKLGSVENALQSVVTDHGSVGKLIAEGDVDHVIFTGSVEGGRRVQQNASGRFIDCNLELGGKDGAYVAEDADLDKAAADLVDGAMYNAGQSCCGIERVYAHRNVFDAFVSRCRDLVKGYVLGDPMDRKTTMGPLASPPSAEEMLAQIQAAESLGAKVLEGGKIRRIGSAVFFEPTLLIGATQNMAVIREENFGPILPIVSVADDDEAIQKINDSRYGLTSVIYSRSVERAERFAAQIDSGTVFLNRCDYLDPALPWTGVRDSGRGTTLSKYGFYSLTRRKAIHFRLP